MTTGFPVMRWRRLGQRLAAAFARPLVPLAARPSRLDPADRLVLGDPALDHLGPFLDFTKAVEARYEADTGVERVAHLRVSIVLGLIFYNAYNLTDQILLSDIQSLGVVLRTFLVTPVSLLLAWLVGRVSPRIREALVGVGMVNVIAVPPLLYALSSAGYAAYSLPEIALTLVFGSTMLVLRFRWALAYTLGTLLMTFGVLAAKAGLAGDLAWALALQVVTAAFFTLYGNYRLEAARRATYLMSLREILRSEQLESDSVALATLSMTDPLTGLANRRRLDDALARWLCEVAPSQEPLSVLMVDVDHFKRFNDTYGHPEGDACLKRVALAIAAEAKGATALVARYGGEEFAVLVRARADVVEDLAGRVCGAVARMRLPHRGREDGLAVVTVSVGAATAAPRCDGSAVRLVAAADRALYQAKSLGRNRAVVRDLDRDLARDPVRQADRHVA